VTLRASGEEVGLTMRLPPRDGCEGQVAFPGELLSEFEGGTDTDVILELVAGKSQARWDDRGVPKVSSFDLIDAERIPALPSIPRRLTHMPPTFLKILDDACRTASRETVRLSLNRIQLRGKAGQIVATDGKQLLVQGGLNLPFGADLLVPALPVFGTREVANAMPIGLGRSDGRVLIRAGIWCLDLKIDGNSRFPKVESVIPSDPHPTCLVLSDADATHLIDAVPGLPDADNKDAPITLDLGKQVLVRAKGQNGATELLLSNSSVTGSACRVSVNRQLLFRALRLGFRSIEVHAPDKPLVARDGERLMVFVTFDPTFVVQPSPDDVRIATTATGIARVDPSTERTPTVTTSNNGNQTQTTDKPDPLVEAEALRTALQEALNCSNRLIASLRQYRKQRKVVQSAMASLRQLQLNP
jgi:hypothetical protein